MQQAQSGLFILKPSHKVWLFNCTDLFFVWETTGTINRSVIIIKSRLMLIIKITSYLSTVPLDGSIVSHSVANTKKNFYHGAS